MGEAERGFLVPWARTLSTTTSSLWNAESACIHHTAWSTGWQGLQTVGTASMGSEISITVPKQNLTSLIVTNTGSRKFTPSQRRSTIRGCSWSLADWEPAQTDSRSVLTSIHRPEAKRALSSAKSSVRVSRTKPADSISLMNAAITS